MQNIGIDPQKELFKWGPINLKLFYGSIFIDTILSSVHKMYKWPWPETLCVFKDGKIVWISEQLALSEVGAKYFKKYFLNTKAYGKLWADWEKWTLKYDIFYEEIKDIELRSLSDKEFIKLIEELYKLNTNFWLIVHIPEIANWGGEYLLKNKLEELDKEKANGYLEILSTPIKYSFFQEEDIDLLKIASLGKEDFNQKIKEHQEKYYWILNSYGGNSVLGVNFFKKKLRDIARDKKVDESIEKIKNSIQRNIDRKETLEKKLKLDKEVVLIADQLSQSIWWQDLRKGYIWKLNSIWDRLIKEIAKRNEWEQEDLQWCYYRELLALSRKKEVNKQNILQRKESYFIYSKKGKGLVDSYDKEEADKLLDIYSQKADKNIKSIKGLVVSKGNGNITKGRIKIVKNPFLDINSFEEGDILVAGMTSPEYIVLMRKAKAIITDNGGMTCHAAIVSRELGTPCLVGTKIATQVLKDGDKVEIDIDKGEIIILS